MEGEIGDLTGYYAYPEATSSEMQTVVITSKGKSPRDVRLQADLKVEQTLDLSMLSTVLMSDNTAKNDIYNYLDIYFRDPFNPITVKLALVQGELGPFFDISTRMKSESGEYYERFIESLEENSIAIPYTMQTVGSVLFQPGKDLALPYLKMDEQGLPSVEGLALFSGRSFSGESLSPEQSLLLNILNNTLGRQTMVNYLYEDQPVSFRVMKANRDIKVSDGGITINNNLDVVINEFPQDHIERERVRKDLEKFLSSEVQKEMEKVIDKLQKAKSDAIGIGEIVRAFHTKYYHEDWSEHFSTLDIKVNVNLEITQTGVLY